MAVQSYKELFAWQKAMDLAVLAATATFPSEEWYGLPVTIKRAAVAVPSRIAEGQGHGQGGDFARYLMLARGLLQEIDTQLILSVRLGFLAPTPTTRSRTNSSRSRNSSTASSARSTDDAEL